MTGEIKKNMGERKRQKLSRKVECQGERGENGQKTNEIAHQTTLGKCRVDLRKQSLGTSASARAGTFLKDYEAHGFQKKTKKNPQKRQHERPRIDHPPGITTETQMKRDRLSRQRPEKEGQTITGARRDLPHVEKRKKDP